MRSRAASPGVGSVPRRPEGWAAVYWYLTWWHDDGTVERIHDTLRAKVRQADGRNAEPTAGLIDSQSVRSADTVSKATSGYDAGRKTRGRKRFIVTDTPGLLLAVHVVAASVQGRDARSAPCCGPASAIRPCGRPGPARASPAAWSPGPRTSSTGTSTSSASPQAGGVSWSSRSAGVGGRAHVRLDHRAQTSRLRRRTQTRPRRDHDPLGRDRPRAPTPHPTRTSHPPSPRPLRHTTE